MAARHNSGRMPPAAKVEFTPRQVTIIRASFAALVIVILLLMFAVPRSPPPPATLANPNEAFVDRAGIVSPAFAREWAGALLNDDRAQIVVYVDRKPPEGDLAAWAIQTASDWKIGTARNDSGLVLFVFTEPRLARVDVGYGLEDRLTDARVRQLLETHLAPAFAQGEYEKGFDALIFAIRKEIGGDDAASIHARAAEARRRDDVPFYSLIVPAFARAPRVISGTYHRFLEELPVARFVILVMAGVVLAVFAFGVGMAFHTARSLVTLPASIRARRDKGTGVAIAASLFELGLALFGLAIAVGLLMLVLLAAESFFTRTGSFSGAGAVIVWPAPG